MQRIGKQCTIYVLCKTGYRPPIPLPSRTKEIKKERKGTQEKKKNNNNSGNTKPNEIKKNRRSIEDNIDALEHLIFNIKYINAYGQIKYWHKPLSPFRQTSIGCEQLRWRWWRRQYTHTHTDRCIHANTRSTICTTSTFKSAKVSFYTIWHPPPLLDTYMDIYIYPTYILVVALNTLPLPSLCLLSLFFFFLFVIPARLQAIFYCIISLFLFYYFLSAFQSWSFNWVNLLRFQQPKYG